MAVNIYAAWIAFFLGGLAGAATGLLFHRDDHLGGYISWPRRLVRLGHISFFGLGLLNLALALSAEALQIDSGLTLPSALLLIGLATMPTVCYLSAWKMPFRHLFFLPAGSAILAVALFLWRIALP